MKEITLPANFDNIHVVIGFITEQVEPLNCPAEIEVQLSVVIDEIFGNIARYAYAPDEGPATVRFEIREDPRQILITFIDRGMPFNPLNASDPDTTLPARQRRIGGLGIFMVKSTMDGMSYEYRDGQNILTIIKNL